MTLQKFAYRPSQKPMLSSNKYGSRVPNENTDNLKDDIIICSNKEDDSQLSDVICMDDMKSNENTNLSTSSTVWDPTVHKAADKESVKSGNHDTNDECLDEVVWDLDDSFELLPSSTNPKSQKENRNSVVTISNNLTGE